MPSLGGTPVRGTHAAGPRRLRLEPDGLRRLPPGVHDLTALSDGPPGVAGWAGRVAGVLTRLAGVEGGMVARRARAVAPLRVSRPLAGGQAADRLGSFLAGPGLSDNSAVRQGKNLGVVVAPISTA